MSARYLGMRAGDLEGKPYARYWSPKMAPISHEAISALARGPLASVLLPPLARANELLAPGDHDVESGFAFAEGGAMHVAIRTAMPEASPKMVDWWFGWHSDEPERYKLWHPQAHVHASWAKGSGGEGRGRAAYVGHTSLVDEYLGGKLGRYAIRFVAPRELGFDDAALANDDEATAVCARIGFAQHPIDFGWLVHHVRRVPGGSEMRSRFWIGGPHAAGREGSALAALAAPVLRKVARPREADGRALLAHCAEEMAHLAGFLPRLFGELGA